MTPVADLFKTLDCSVLKDINILVTGGASGLGALIATSFVEYGYGTMQSGHKQSQHGAELQSPSQISTKRLNYVSTDVTDWQSQVTAFKSAITYSGRRSIDVVVATAGVGGQPFIVRDEEPPSLDKDHPLPRSACLNIDVNAKGVYYTSKLAQHYFALRPSLQTKATPSVRKCLVVIRSLAGYLEINDSDYTASKWAVRGLFRSTRSKMEDLGYRK
ncbi:MAG: hypothetical protein ALECFALPRED_005001 [Alectoria fallacina]|uniref:Uncharacterized protein n=1 Tax=Alectoria fallacina TaxID=1903189 RepID=A0A8H3ITH8_9LECA|nr:MAG: hypothetical protein ALECFALPRED_005001 [Alectoria fallacina]